MAESVRHAHKTCRTEAATDQNLQQPMRNPEDEVVEIAKLITENYDDNYVRETFHDLTLQLSVPDQAYSVH